MGVCSRVGIPASIQSDNASDFVSRLNKEVYKRLGIEMRNSTPLHPEGNSIVERSVQTVKRMLYHVMNDGNPRDWDRKLMYIMWALHEVETRRREYHRFS